MVHSHHLSRELSVCSLWPRLIRMQLHRQLPRVQVSQGGQSWRMLQDDARYHFKTLSPLSTGWVPHLPGVWASWGFYSCGVFPAVVHPETSGQTRLNEETCSSRLHCLFFLLCNFRASFLLFTLQTDILKMGCVTDFSLPFNWRALNICAAHTFKYVHMEFVAFGLFTAEICSLRSTFSLLWNSSSTSVHHLW